MSQLNNYTVSVIDGHEVMVFTLRVDFFPKIYDALTTRLNTSEAAFLLC